MTELFYIFFSEYEKLKILANKTNAGTNKKETKNKKVENNILTS